MRTALLIDGGFFLRRHQAIAGRMSPEETADALHKMCTYHCLGKKSRDDEKRKQVMHLYRIFFYDCEPLQKKAHNPISGELVDFAKSDSARWRMAFHEALRKKRKVALRLGYLNERSAAWSPTPDALKLILTKRLCVEDLRASDVQYKATQKGVDMRVGIDIASLAFKRQVDQIVLVAGDSDFVPAAKLARREGIDFVLDPMWASIRPDLHEHIDGLRSVIRRPDTPSTKSSSSQSAPES